MDIYTIPESLKTPMGRGYYLEEARIIGGTCLVTDNGKLIPLTECLKANELAALLKDIETQAARLETWFGEYNAGTSNHSGELQTHSPTGNPYNFVSLLN